MLNDITIRIIYKNRDMEITGVHDYSLVDYSNLISSEIKSVITDVENLVLHTKGDKSDWDDDTMKMFQKIRHELLDHANSIGRLPSNICYKGESCNSISMSDFIAKQFEDNRK